MSFSIVPRCDLSLQDLVALHCAGHSVVKTPHVGNWYPNNLAVASLGIPMHVYDHMVGVKDENFHPHKLIVNGHGEKMADSAILITHARVIRAPSRFPERFPVGSRVLDGHMQAVRDAVPGANCEVSTDYLQQYMDMVLAILETVTNLLPKLWHQFVDADGTVSERSCIGWDSIRETGVYGLTNDEFGWLIPNVLNVLMDGVIEAVLHKESVVYHLSGPDMFRYIGKYKATLTEIHSILRQKLDWVPETVEMHLVPVASMRFAVPEARRQTLDTFVDALLAIYAWRTERGEKNTFGCNGRRANATAAGTEDKKRQQREALLIDPAAACTDVWYDIKKGSFVSQYDLLAAGTRIYVHPWALGVPITALWHVEDYITNIRKRKEQLGSRSWMD